MSESRQELHEDYQAGLISDENWQKWEEFFKSSEQAANHRSVSPERIETLNATEYSTQNAPAQYANTQPLTPIEGMIAGLIDMGWPIVVLALIVLDFVF